MKLYTNRYNKNSLIDKTEPDVSVKGTPTQIMKHYIFIENERGYIEKIRVYTEKDILKNQLHFLDGTPLNEDDLKTYFMKENGRHCILVNNTVTTVCTARGLKRKAENQKKKQAKLLEVVDLDPALKTSLAGTFDAIDLTTFAEAEEASACEKEQGTNSARRHKPMPTTHMSSSSSTVSSTGLELLDLDPALINSLANTYNYASVDTTSVAEAEEASTLQKPSTQSAVNLHSKNANSRHHQQWSNFLAKTRSTDNTDKTSENNAGNVSAYRRK